MVVTVGRSGGSAPIFVVTVLDNDGFTKSLMSIAVVFAIRSYCSASIESWNKMLNKNGYGIIKVLGVSFFAEPRKPDCVYLTPEEVFSSYLSQQNRLVIPGETNGVINSLENSKYINIMLDQYSGFYETNFKQ